MLKAALLVLVVFAIALTSASPNAPTDLRVEYLPSPVIGMDKPNPRFSYLISVNDGSRGQFQTSVQILVSTDPSVSTGNVWNLIQKTNQTSQITFAGSTLQSDTTYYWKVRWFDQNGNPSPYSSIARFDTAFFSTSDWQGSWIGWPSNQAINHFRKEFTLTSSPIVRARAFICGLGYYELFINGKRIGDSYLDPGWTQYAKRSLYVEYDVTSNLLNGGNAVGVLLGGGWYIQGVNGPRSLLFQLNVDFQDGSSASVVSDDSWVISTGAITYDSIYNGETYDARAEQTGWSSPNFKPTTPWTPAQKISGPGGVVSLQMMPPIKKSTIVNTVKVTQPQAGYYVYDFGQNLSGWTKLTVANCPSGTTIILKYAELLQFNGNGMIYTDNLRSAKATDTYICKGVGTEVYEPHFTYHGFQFVQLTGFPGTPQMSTLQAIHVYSSVNTTGTISFNNAILNTIQQNIWWGQTSNFMSVPTDCDQRDERLGWMADGQLSVEEAIHNFDVSAFYSNWAMLMNDELGTDGSMTDTVPHMRYGNRPADPAWGAAYPCLIYWIYKYYDDTTIINNYYEGLVAYINFLTGKASSSGLRNMYGYYGDWVPPPPAAKASVSFTSAWYYILNVRQVAEMASAIGKTADSTKFFTLYRSLITQFNAAFYNSASKSYDIGVQTDLVLPLFLDPDMVPQSDHQAVVTNLINNIEIACDNHLSTGILGTKYLMLSLSQVGYTNLALDITLTKSYPGWTWEFDNQTYEVPATTLWELWDAPLEGPGMNSRNHIMYGSISDWFYKHLAGIQQPSWGSGYKYIVIAQPPVDVGLQKVAASVTWPVGNIQSSWTLGSKSVALLVTFPVNTVGEIHVATGVSSSIAMIYESSKLVWSNGKYVPGNGGFTGGVAGPDGKSVVFYVGSGSYSFSHSWSFEMDSPVLTSN